jgi:t-SNARE complex subunit (syntaxin)
MPKTPLTDVEYRQQKLALMERMAASLEDIAKDVHNIWNEMPEPPSPFKK